MKDAQTYKGFLNFKLFNDILNSYKESSGDYKLTQLNIFISYIDVEDWLIEHFPDYLSVGNMYEFYSDDIRISLLKVRSYKSDHIEVFPIYRDRYGKRINYRDKGDFDVCCENDTEYCSL